MRVERYSSKSEMLLKFFYINNYMAEIRTNCKSMNYIFKIQFSFTPYVSSNHEEAGSSSCTNLIHLVLLD